MFQILDDSNTAKITLTNNLTGNSRTWLIGTSSKDIAYAVMSFAKVEGISPRDVGYSVVFPVKDSTPINYGSF